jgi:trk system potassium uptake protein TrkA
MMNVIIVGGGKVGSYLAALLIKENHQVKVIENNREKQEQLKRNLPEDVLVQGSGTDPELLEAAGIHRADVVAAVTGEDENNLVVTNLARFEFNVPRVIGRVNNPKNAWLYTPEMGVDAALNQADLLGRMIAEEMSLGDMMVLLKLRKGQFSLVEEKVHPHSQAAGKTIQEINFPVRASCSLVAVLRKGDLIMPEQTTQLQPADEILAVVKADHLAELKAILDPNEPSD